MLKYGQGMPVGAVQVAAMQGRDGWGVDDTPHGRAPGEAMTPGGERQGSAQPGSGTAGAGPLPGAAGDAQGHATG
jgi:hypothetical protein